MKTTLRLKLLMLATFVFVLPAFAQEADAAPAAAAPWWQSLLMLGIVGAITLALLLHPFLKLASLFKAMAQDANGSALKHSVGATGEYLSTALDHFLEESGQDFKDLATNDAKRAAAVQAIKQRALAEGPAAIVGAVKQLGETFLAGKASQIVDMAVANAPVAPPSPDSPPKA